MKSIFDRCRSCTSSDIWAKVPILCITFMLLLFVGLVAVGLTGSSLGALYTKSSIVSVDGRLLTGSPKAIRSDEWGVITPHGHRANQSSSAASRCKPQHRP